MHVRPIKTRVFTEGENLEKFIHAHIPKLKENSVLVVTSKIVSLAERRTAIKKNAKTKEELIKKESDFAILTKYTWLTLRKGILIASAGIDESNANGKFILLPKDSFHSAALLREKLKKAYKVKNLGLLITDSITLPLRAGAVGIALGYAGFKAIRDYRGTPDIFGRPFTLSRADVGDGLGATAVLAMGEGKEQTPLVVIEGAPVEFTEKVKRGELSIPFADDMYLPFLSGLLKKKKK